MIPWTALMLTTAVVLAAVGLFLMLPRANYLSRLAAAGLAGISFIGCAAGRQSLDRWVQQPGFLVLAGLVVVSGLLVLAIPSSRIGTLVGAVIIVLALGLGAGAMPPLRETLAQGVFWVLAGTTLTAGALMVAMRSAVYSAIWFALSLLGTAGLLMFQGAEFLAVATVAVYAGAIVVTFLFVIMLAQPEGHETFDRLTWGWYVKPLSVLAGAGLVAVLSVCLAGLGEAAAAAPAIPVTETTSSVARLGTELFGRHLVAVEVAGTLLLVALVGAVAMTLHGRATPAGRSTESNSLSTRGNA